MLINNKIKIDCQIKNEFFIGAWYLTVPTRVSYIIRFLSSSALLFLSIFLQSSGVSTTIVVLGFLMSPLAT